MTQRAVVWEVDEDNGAMSVADIFEWPEDRLDLNKRRLLRHVKRHRYGKIQLQIIQIETSKTLYARTMEVK